MPNLEKSFVTCYPAGMPHKLPYNQYLREKLPRQAERFIARLYPEDQERRAAFLAALLTGTAKVPALFWLGEPPTERPFPVKRLTDWQPDWVDVIADLTVQPSRLPYYFEGAYYPLDFSSITTASALLAIPEGPQRILDLCSAPGGKAIFAWRALQPAELVCNELVAKRHLSLRSNLDRCRVPATITRHDSAVFSQTHPEAFDLVLVDAPCSGQSLFARGETASGAFQDHMVNMNMSRQRRILANATATLRTGGHLFYSTCTYSYEENEKNVKWLIRKFPDLKPIPVPHLEPYRSSLTDLHCYRIEPQHGLGAGGFVTLFKKDASKSGVA